MNKRILGFVVAVALAAGGAFVVLSYVNSAEERAVAGEQTVEVIVVAEPIPRGASGTSLGSAVRTALVPAKVRAADAVITLNDLSGKVAAVDLVPGEQLVRSRFVAPEELAKPTSVEVPAGLLLVTVSLTPERAVGGQLVPGDLVAVAASFDPFDYSVVGTGGEFPDAVPVGDEATIDLPSVTSAKTPNSSHLILHKVLVTNVQQERLPTDKTIDDAQQQGVDLAPTGNLLVTLALNASEVEKVVFSSEHGTVWLAREPVGASEAGTTIQTRGTVYQ